ncbi:hypothetical protein ACFV4P_03610 [Kitasatospora sp. NPDC059795]|uniref:hypothetical protein n=1 Tax=Kitasatospora sp. NPDC059795 TaxID=3346949 RepID=UPI003669AB60
MTRLLLPIVDYEPCFDHEVPHAVARGLWAHDMNSPFAAGEHVSVDAAGLLEERARREAVQRTRRSPGFSAGRDE